MGNKIQHKLNTLFTGKGKISGDNLREIYQQLASSLDLDQIVDKLRQHLIDVFNPSIVHIYLFNPGSAKFHAATGFDGQRTSDLRFSLEDPIAVMLSGISEAILLEDSKSLPKDLAKDRDRLLLLAATLFVPFMGQEGLVGWLALGPRNDGQQYARDDLAYLESLSEQVALNIERILVVTKLEQRVKEMDVLTQVAQGVNITVDFDDMLELIYAQTSYVIPGDDFRVTLKDSSNSKTLRHVFYLEHDERITDKEKLPLHQNQSLAYEIISSRREIRTDDYERRCRSSNVLPDTEGLLAWLSVPLNAGAETIGAISTGSRDPTVSYTDQHAKLLQAIADQAASAIIKTRLLIKTEHRARQLATLNEIGRSLTSTLATKPLLKQILESAMEILNCEAGSLFMVDDQTGDLTFEVTVGPVADDLAGEHLAAGTGIAGKVAATGRPAIANEVQKLSGWNSEADKKTGFVTRDLLVVPMQVKDRVTGVIEVINKEDGTPFSDEDQELLTTFGIQAAIAVENARLYTQTDAALSARVEEMSILQRIDRELNASLNLSKTLQITLDWSMRQSDSDAGLIGLIDSGKAENLRLMAYSGYSNELDRFIHDHPSDKSTDIFIPLISAEIKDALFSAEPRLINLNDRADIGQTEASGPGNAVYPKGDTSPLWLLEGARSQLLLPITRKPEPIALLILESTINQAYSEDVITFLTRLCDHAAIAISNSQLFAEVEEANKAKSEFVSLVSHELKTPMTSIRGYTDLLTQGSVGPVNEFQMNFLGTIRSNVDRMATLVSDLTDVSRIESGRLYLEFSALSLADAIAEVVRSVKGQIEEKNQTLEVNLSEELPNVWGDYNRTIQILSNLISNANKYSPEGGIVTITAQQRANQWDPGGAPEVVLIEIKDTGYGIAPEDQLLIFRKFFRSEDANVREIPGTGLGLNITRHLVEMQGGRIWFESQVDRGTTFTFTIPVAAIG